MTLWEGPKDILMIFVLDLLMGNEKLLKQLRDKEYIGVDSA
jgi:hypothetical protein